jgi:hypothetical protein
MSKEKSLGDWIKDGTFTIDRLDKVVSDVLNGGRGVAWIGVRSPTTGFNYSLTEEKVVRLKAERISWPIRKTILILNCVEGISF